MHTYRLVLLAVLFTAQIVAHADTVFLTDGTKREGKIEEESDRGLKLRVKHGPLSAVIEIARKEIASVERAAVAVDESELEFQVLRKEAERLATLDKQQGAQAWVRFAKFCAEKPGYTGYAENAYEKALALDPLQVEARTALGYTWDAEAGWQGPQKAVAEAKADYNSMVIAARAAEKPLSYTPVAYTPAAANETPVYESTYSNGNYSRSTYYVDGGSYGHPSSVVFLASQNGRLVPYAGSSHNYYTGGYNSNSGYSSCYSSRRERCGVNGVVSGGVGYYSDGYYRSNSYGVSAFFSGRSGSTSFRGSINGGGFRGGGSGWSMSGTGFRFGGRW